MHVNIGSEDSVISIVNSLFNNKGLRSSMGSAIHEWDTPLMNVYYANRWVRISTSGMKYVLSMSIGLFQI